jgi:uncharacterized protein (DUF433 family)
MESDLIHDRGRGPEIVGTRVTVYNLLPNFLDPAATEAYICQLYELTPEQVAAARAYVLNHADTVLARHLEIEAKIDLGNPAEVIERAKRTHADFVRFKNWLAEREQSAAGDVAEGSNSPNPGPNGGRVPTLKQWLAECGADTGGMP